MIHCNREVTPIGCKVSDLPFYWCAACGSIKTCESAEWISPVGTLLSFTEHVQWILGRPNFSVARLGQMLIKLEPGTYGGSALRAESEQAVALHFMLNMYIQHGDKWREAMDTYFNERKTLPDAPKAVGPAQHTLRPTV